MRQVIQFFSLAICFSLVFLNKATAQDQPGVADSLESTVLKQKRYFRVAVPEGYDPNQQTKYDVLYVTDGNWNITVTKQIQDFLLEQGFMPKNIIVSVDHLSRDKDLTPTPGNNPSVFGGATEFLSFLEKELIPYINKKYSTTGTNTLFGHSYGGLFVTYALLTNPKPFDTYIAVDPSFWWDNRYMAKLASEKLDPALHNNKALFITGRGGPQSEEMGIPSLDSVFKQKAPAGLRWKVVDYPGETHNSVKFKSIYDGLRFTYDGFNARFMVHPQKGIVMKDKPYKVWVLAETDVTLRYTTDGSDPTVESKLANREITLSEPSVVTVKPITASKKPGRTIKVEFKEGTMVPAVAKPKNIKPGGPSL